MPEGNNSIESMLTSDELIKYREEERKHDLATAKEEVRLARITNKDYQQQKSERTFAITLGTAVTTIIVVFLYCCLSYCTAPSSPEKEKSESDKYIACIEKVDPEDVANCDTDDW